MGEWGAARALAVSWLDALATWLEVTDAWPAAEGKATLRMEEVSGLDPWRDRRVERQNTYVVWRTPQHFMQYMHHLDSSFPPCGGRSGWRRCFAFCWGSRPRRGS